MRKTLSIAVVCSVLTATLVWVARGVYDTLTLDEGVFHVVNHVDRSRVIELSFPSSERRSATFGPGEAIDFTVDWTGEGSITVVIDELELDPIGYVTSQNGLSVVVVGEDSISFTQRFR